MQLQKRIVFHRIQLVVALLGNLAIVVTVAACPPPLPPPKGWEPPPWSDEILHTYGRSEVVVLARVVRIDYYPDEASAYKQGGVQTFSVQPIEFYKGDESISPKQLKIYSMGTDCDQTPSYALQSRLLIFAASPNEIKLAVRDSSQKPFEVALRAVSAAAKDLSHVNALNAYRTCTVSGQAISGTWKECWENDDMQLSAFTQMCSSLKERALTTQARTTLTYANKCSSNAQASCKISKTDVTRYYYALHKDELSSAQISCKAYDGIWAPHSK